MSNRLFLLPQALPSGDWPAVLLTGASAQHLNLIEAGRRLAGEPTGVVLPVELFSCWSTGPWPRRPSLQALGYAIEEQLSVPLDTLHLAAAPLDGDRRCAVRACDQRVFAHVMALLEAAGVTVHSLHIDADLLPGEQAVALWLFDRWLLGGEGPERLALSAQDVDGSRDLLGDRVMLSDQGDLARTLAQLVPTPTTPNLLPPTRFRWPVKSAAVCLLALIALECVLNGASAWHQQRLAHALEARTTSHLKALLPDAPSDGSVFEQLQALQRGAAPSGEPLIAERLSQLAQALVGAQGVTLQRIEWEAQGAWTLRLSAPSMADIERLRERASEHQLPLQLLTATQDAGRTVAVMSLEDTL